MFYHQYELLAKQRVTDLERKSLNAWKFRSIETNASFNHPAPKKEANLACTPRPCVSC
ncbi:hypothetical protein [Bacillus pinisoli]|uniref:hypothetical protein n=1 Tax=Bacillus pinisoli TaxID=2901866 RepID=UPI001FF53935|nr:hypothetical protein [Bacillus pinisoli]